MARWAAASDATVGRVVRVDRGLASVLTESGPQRVSIGGGLLGRMAQDPTEGPCTGDWCVLRDWPDNRVTLERILPRRTAVVRAVAGETSHGQVLCTNLDVAAVVVALHPLPVLAKVERLVALAWESGARPLVVLTKCDLVNDADLFAEDVADAAPGVDVLTVSARTGEGVDALRGRVEGRLTMALLGASGHGKSSLTNALVGADVLSTRTIRDDGRGRHTSVRRELVPLPGGGAVIDTPGLRGIGLIDAEVGVAQTFADVEALAGTCRFRDCAHDTEPDCAVRAALADGSLTWRRFESWQHLQRELRWIASRKDARLRAERIKEWKRRTRDAHRSRP
ncbi:MAG: ribosome small subunit-dependent GTPase A [Nocardioidaceae bacterium]|nr:ribosome small subunit-dependent GTPase A [Nocardioidaceae bacterium]NUS51494.1 ribosome small subunit-dependent GTPase A [Nocardioidaceae bacterium]